MSKTISVKVVESGDHAQSQAAWTSKFSQYCDWLVSERLASFAKLNVVFQGSANPALATIFTIDLEPTGKVVMDQALQDLQQVPGVQYAHLAPARRAASARVDRSILLPAQA